jgi:hypothetical protein
MEKLDKVYYDLNREEREDFLSKLLVANPRLKQESLNNVEQYIKEYFYTKEELLKGKERLVFEDFSAQFENYLQEDFYYVDNNYIVYEEVVVPRYVSINSKNR